MSFTLTLPEDNVLILNAMSRALAEIAVNVAHGKKFEPTPEPFVSVKNHEHSESVGAITEPVEFDPSKVMVRFEPSGVEVTNKGATLNGEPLTPVTPTDLNVPAEYEPEGDTLLPDLDKHRLPWDKRINSTPASLTGANEWKMRRKPKDMDDDQWAEYIETVRNELTNLMSIEVDDDTVDTSVDGDDVLLDSIVDTDIVEPVAPPVTPEAVFGTTEPEPVTPPTTPATAVEPVAPPPAITTFPQLMTWLTGMTGKVTVEQVNGALAEWNMNSVALLAKRPDLIPAFITKIEGLLK